MKENGFENIYWLAMLTFFFVCSLIVWDFLLIKYIFLTDAENKSEIPDHMQESKHERKHASNINNNGSEAIRILIIIRIV